ncbi:MAG: molybdate ABC transporter permease subunit [Planctomycetaceae bacterium]|nr:Molybdenum transport system permease protein ModB [Planctomycetota bacterium]MCQ3949820.1 molybdate ABC transporter permease subunit [Planctomycetota bacterium]NUO17260.1 molybdate ABC transporter permease subunit [Planctomycetaceae bacterium]GIK51127.1 MAG: molybdate ABC transporter permease [Planctomycetota bacterium]HRJ78661.1 molybdate ABC transporter permease subunit [Planctomycetota bacterium]
MTPAELEIVWLTLRVGALSVALSLVPGVLLGWLLARWNSPLRALVQGVIMLPLVLPPVVTGYLLLKVFGVRGPVGSAYDVLFGGRIAFTTAACVIAASVVGFPLMVESIRLSILGVDRRLEQVSRTLGRGRLGTFARVTLPLALPGIVGGSVLSFARSLGEFGATIILAGDIEGETRTIPIAVYSALNAVDGEAAALRLVLVSVVISLLSLLAAFAFMRRQRTQVA